MRGYLLSASLFPGLLSACCVVARYRPAAACGLGVAAVAAAICLLGEAKQAQATPIIYEAAADWSSTVNPNGVWSYGGYSGTTVDPATFFVFAVSESNPVFSQLDQWVATANTPPRIMYNPGATFTGGTVYFEAGKIVFGPNRGIPVLRWTAPSAGTVNVSAVFTNVQTDQTMGGVSIYVGSSRAYFQEPGGGYETSYTASLTDVVVAAGTAIDFVVDSGWNGTASSYLGNTQVEAELVLVPEPDEWATLSSGLCALLGLTARKRARRPRERHRN